VAEPTPAQGTRDNGANREGRGAPLLHPVDSVIALILFAACGWLYYLTTRFEEVPALLDQNIPPGFFPQLVLIAIALFTAALPFEHHFLRRAGRDIDADRRDRIRPMAWLTMALLVAVIAAAQELGTYLTMVAVCALLPPLWGERRLTLLLPFAIGFPTAVALLFAVVLGVAFEPGFLGIRFR